MRGHSIEIRIYAEDPANNFLPDVGILQTYQTPQGPGVRVDDGFTEGMEIPIYYDPMIAKLITTGNTRNEAIQRMLRAIEDYVIIGVQTTLDLGRFIVQHPAFVDGTFNTKFIEKYFSPEALNPVETASEGDLEALSVVASYLTEENKRRHIPNPPKNDSRWKLRKQ